MKRWLCVMVYRVPRKTCDDKQLSNIVLMTTLRVLDSLTWCNTCSPRCLEDRFLPQQNKENKHHQSKAAPVHVCQLWEPPNGHMNCTAIVGLPRRNSLIILEWRASLGKRDSSKDDRSALSLPAPRLQGNCPQAVRAALRHNMEEKIIVLLPATGSMVKSTDERCTLESELEKLAPEIVGTPVAEGARRAPSIMQRQSKSNDASQPSKCGATWAPLHKQRKTHVVPAREAALERTHPRAGRRVPHMRPVPSVGMASKT